ncbi:MAG: hypothetical protein QXZ53_05225 [Candidatus Bathyarchaeia archaeon]
MLKKKQFTDVDFNKALLESVDESLSALGESVKQAIYWHLKTRYKIDRDEIPLRLKDFVEVLKTVFGEGANVLFKLIAKNLCLKMGVKFKERADWNLLEYINYIKNIKL